MDKINGRQWPISLVYLVRVGSTWATAPHRAAGRAAVAARCSGSSPGPKLFFSSRRWATCRPSCYAECLLQKGSKPLPGIRIYLGSGLILHLVMHSVLGFVCGLQIAEAPNRSSNFWACFSVGAGVVFGRSWDTQSSLRHCRLRSSGCGKYCSWGWPSAFGKCLCTKPALGTTELAVRTTSVLFSFNTPCFTVIKLRSSSFSVLFSRFFTQVVYMKRKTKCSFQPCAAPSLLNFLKPFKTLHVFGKKNNKNQQL